MVVLPSIASGLTPPPPARGDAHCGRMLAEDFACDPRNKYTATIYNNGARAIDVCMDPPPPPPCNRPVPHSTDVSELCYIILLCTARSGGGLSPSNCPRGCQGVKPTSASAHPYPYPHPRLLMASSFNVRHANAPGLDNERRRGRGEIPNK